MGKEKNESNDDFVCPYGVDVKTTENCIDNYVDATSLQWKKSRCFQCSYGRNTRKKFADSLEDDIEIVTPPKIKRTRKSSRTPSPPPTPAKKPSAENQGDDIGIVTPPKIKRIKKSSRIPSPPPILEGISDYRIYHILILRRHATGKKSFTTKKTVMQMAEWLGFDRAKTNSKKQIVQKVISKIVRANLGEITCEGGKVTIKWLHDPNLLWPEKIAEIKPRSSHR